MKEYTVKFFQRAYELISPNYARDRRMVKFNELVETGELVRMCAFEVHKMFGIRKCSCEF